MKVLVTGGAGYLGSVLVPKLLARGHQVRVVDLGYFGLDHLRRLWSPGATSANDTPRWRRVEVIREDLRSIMTKPTLGRELIDGCDAVIHLAAISNDPSADLHPDLTDEVNVGVTARLAELARDRRVPFLFSSSCSIYGAADGEIDEFAATNPLTVYASSKVTAERILGDLASAHWRPTILRNGTLFGYSPRMRFDLVVNNLAAAAWTAPRHETLAGLLAGLAVWVRPDALVGLAALPAALLFSTVFYISLYFTFADCFELDRGDAPPANQLSGHQA